VPSSRSQKIDDRGDEDRASGNHGVKVRPVGHFVVDRTLL